MVSQPNSSAKRSAAIYILHCSNVCSLVSSLTGSVPQSNFIPFFSNQSRTACASSSDTVNIFAYKVDWLRSEEHTSELQSRENLVCRRLLEKKEAFRLQPPYQ